MPHRRPPARRLAPAFAVLAVAAAASSVPSARAQEASAARAREAEGPGGTLVVVNKAGASATLLDVATGRTLAEIPVGEGPHEVVVSADGSTAVVTVYGGRVPGDRLAVIDVADGTLRRTIRLGEHRRPHGIAFLPGDREALVTSESSGHVVRVDIETGDIVQALPTEQDGSHMLALAAPAGRVWTSNLGDASLTGIDLAAGRPVQFLAVPPQPEAIGVTPDGVEVWFGSNAARSVGVAEPASGDVEIVLEDMGRPYRTLVTPDARHVLVPDYGSDQLIVVDRAERTVRHAITFPGGGPQGIAVADDGRTAFLSLSAVDRVALIDLETGEVLRLLEAGPRPDGVAWSPLEAPASP
ncbi:MAG: PQQ-binding-like beta-propeller repeat protein [Gemmatimonadota bacterium]|nr:PQQ-binding-like beta-propeller repeat protein [Gemmatimonadota bacterium]